MDIQNNNTNSFPVPAIGVGGIVFNDKRQVLMIQRNQPPAMGLWSVPGGKLEGGESLSDACKREIKEETGLDVVVKNIVAVVERRIESFHYVVIDFLAHLLGDENTMPVAQSDVAEAKWISLDNIQEYDLVDGLAEIIMRTYLLNINDRLGGLYDIDATGADYTLPVMNFTE